MEKKEDAAVPHGPHMAHMTRECPAIAAIRGGGRMGGRVAPARHGLVSIVTARCGLRRATSPVLRIKKAACLSAACLQFATPGEGVIPYAVWGATRYDDP